MTKVLDDALLARAVREAERALAFGDPDTLAGRFLPKAAQAQIIERRRRRQTHRREKGFISKVK